MCIFCKIINHEIPCHQVYEDDKVLAFLDINPLNPGHTLVVPKKHYSDLEEISDEDLIDLILVVKKVGLLIKEKLGFAGYNVSQNNGEVAGQEVPHLHFHVIPRREGDGLSPWPRRGYKAGEAEEVIKKLES